MVRPFFRLAIRDHFFGPLGCLLESLWGVLGLVLGHLVLFWARFGALYAAFWNPLTLYAHQLINASTLQPVARQHLETRAGGLRAERLNKTGVWLFPRVLEGLASSGRLIGTISTYPGTYKCPG